jgi:hypothetical protein
MRCLQDVACPPPQPRALAPSQCRGGNLLSKDLIAEVDALVTDAYVGANNKFTTSLSAFLQNPQSRASGGFERRRFGLIETL